MLLDLPFLDLKSTFVQLSLLSILCISLKSFLSHSKSTPDDVLPITNRLFGLEPRVLALLRWTFNARNILDSAYVKFKGGVYQVARGDLDMVVVPTDFIPELNLLSEDIISSRIAHSYNLVGHLNGIDIVTKTNLHVKTVQHKLTPSLPRLLEPMRKRVGQAIETAFPAGFEWTAIEPMDKLLYCVSRATSFVAVGSPVCDNPEYIRLTSEHAKHVFTTTIILRVVPTFLQPWVVWLLPSKWRLERSMKGMAKFVVPEVIRRRELASKSTENQPVSSDMLSWMMDKARNDQERDPDFLTLLQAVLAAGGTHTTAILTINTLFDLVCHPEFLEMVRGEIKEKHEEINGNWDHAAFNSLYKLDSAMKETMRLTPASLTAYSRFMQKDHTLSNGVTLRKGQMICVSSCSRQKDSSVFPEPQVYNGLRAYNENFERHRARPLKSVDSDGLRWGAGRWACPGRFLASTEAKVILVKLFDEYDFKLVGGQNRPASLTAHEFIFANEQAKIMIRRRQNNTGIVY